jgi:dGTPase
MTHTLEVNQIAKAISSSLGLNIDLTESIALAHDLGHTPFGHQGERTLKDILCGDELKGLFHINNSIFNMDMLGGFKHNFQSVRVLTKLEEKYVEYPGLDISMQVLEGILKHTKIKDAVIEEFIDSEFISELHIENSFASSLEGQVVAVSDEIAQRGHDIDDAITSGLISIDELLESLTTYKFKELYTLLNNEKEKIIKNERPYIDENELIIGRIISCIVGFFIKDVVDFSNKKIDEYIVKYPAYLNDDGIFKDKLIDFSPDKGKVCCGFLEKVVNKRVITNVEVARFDYNAGVIIKRLFEAYYNNPKLLHNGTLRKIYVDTIQSRNIDVRKNAIDLLNGNIDIVKNEIEDIVNYDIKDLTNDFDKIILEKRKILVRNIVDYIAGMTDSYAVKEYERIKW